MKHYIFSILSLLFIAASCNKELRVRDAELDITPDKTTVKAGDPIIFQFGGITGTDILNFFSGEVYNQYEYSYGVGEGRYSINNSGIDFSFQSLFNYNNPSAADVALFGLQKNQLTVWGSKDYDGQLVNVLNPASNWVNITNKFTLPTAVSASYTNSKGVDLSDVYQKGKPFYIAFKVVTKKQETNGFTQIWNITNFAVNSKDSIGGQAVKLYDQNKLEFVFVHLLRDATGRASRAVRASNLLTMGGPDAYLRPGMDTIGLDSLTRVNIERNPDWRDPAHSEVWAVSRAIRTDSVFLGYDKPTANNIVEFKSVQFPKSFGFVYKNPGTYKAVFVGTNSSKDETKTAVREFTITVTP